MSKYGSLVPLFTLISFVNAAYIVGSFKSVMDPAIYVLLNGWTIVCMGITVAGLSPPAKVQSNVSSCKLFKDVKLNKTFVDPGNR